MNKKIGLILCAVAFATGAMAATTTWNSGTDGLWHDNANWSGSFPNAGDTVKVNGTGTVDLGGGIGLGGHVYFGNVVDADVVATNGSLTMSKRFYVGQASNTTAKVYLTDLTKAVGATPNLFYVGSGQDSTGFLSVGGSSSSDWTTLKVGTADRATGTISAASHSFAFSGNASIATGDDSIGSISANSVNVGGNLVIGSGLRSTGTVTTISGLTLADGGNLTAGTGVDSSATISGPVTIAGGGALGNLTIGAGADAGAADVINQVDSSGSITAHRNLSITNMTHTISELTLNEGAVITASGAATLVSDAAGMHLSVATVADNTSTSLNLDDLGFTGSVTGQHIKVATGTDSIGSLTYTAGDLDLLNNAKDISVGSGVDSHGTLTISSGDLAVDNLKVGWSEGSSGTINGGAANFSADLTGGFGDKNNSTGTFSAASFTFNESADGKKQSFGIGSNAVATVNLTGDLTLVKGTFNIANAAGTGFADIDVGSTFTVDTNGVVNMYGGMLDTGDLVINGTGTVNLVDGVLTVGTALTMETGSSLVLGAGELVVVGDYLTELGDLYTDGLITMDIGNGTLTNTFTSSGFDFSYDAVGGGGTNKIFLASAGGNTTMWAETIPEPATIGLMMVIGGGLLFIRRRTMS